MSIGIRGIGTYLPERVVGNAELIGRFGWDADFLERKLGIRERHIAAPAEGAADMAVAAAETLFASQPELDRDAIDLLVLCTQNPDFGLPHSSALVQARLGLPTSTACFDLGLGCSGFVYGLAVVRSMLETLGLTTALLVTSDPYSKVIDPGDRRTSPLFGDGAAATWVADDADNAVGAFTFGTDGGGSEHLIVRRTEGVSSAEPAHLSMNGRAIFEFMLERIPADMERCAGKNGLALADVDLFVLHQASAYMLAYLAKRMGLASDRVPVLLAETGNTVSSSIPFALVRLAADGELAGRTVLLSGFGVGLSWASTIVRFDQK